MKGKTRGKRLLSILLCFVMLLSLVPSTAFATGVGEHTPSLSAVKTSYRLPSAITVRIPSVGEAQMNAATPYYYTPYGRVYARVSATPPTDAEKEFGWMYFNNGVLEIHEESVGAIGMGGISGIAEDLYIRVYGNCELSSCLETNYGKSALYNGSGGDVIIEGMTMDAKLRIRNYARYADQIGLGIYLPALTSQPANATRDVYVCGMGYVWVAQCAETDTYGYASIHARNVNVAEYAALHVDASWLNEADTLSGRKVNLISGNLTINTRGNVSVDASLLSNDGIPSRQLASGDIAVHNVNCAIFKFCSDGSEKKSTDQWDSDDNIVSSGDTVRTYYENSTPGKMHFGSPTVVPYAGDVYIGNTSFVKSAYYHNYIGFNSDPNGANASYDHLTGTLTLNNYAGPQITVFPQSAYSHFQRDFVIDLKGTNTITVDSKKENVLAAAVDDGICIRTKGDLTIKGTGNLTINFPSSFGGWTSGDGISMPTDPHNKDNALVLMEHANVAIRYNRNIPESITKIGVWAPKHTVSLLDNSSLSILIPNGGDAYGLRGVDADKLIVNTDGKLYSEITGKDAIALRGRTSVQLKKVNSLIAKSNNGTAFSYPEGQGDFPNNNAEYNVTKRTDYHSYVRNGKTQLEEFYLRGVPAPELGTRYSDKLTAGVSIKAYKASTGTEVVSQISVNAGNIQLFDKNTNTYVTDKVLDGSEDVIVCIPYACAADAIMPSYVSVSALYDGDINGRPNRTDSITSAVIEFDYGKPYGKITEVHATIEKPVAGQSIEAFLQNPNISLTTVPATADILTVHEPYLLKDKNGYWECVDEADVTFEEDAQYYVEISFSLRNYVENDQLEAFYKASIAENATGTVNGKAPDWVGRDGVWESHEEDLLGYLHYRFTPAKTYTITFDATGGIGGTDMATTNPNGRLSELPGAAKQGYVLRGWFTQPSGGERISTATVFTANTTVYAQWNELIPEVTATMTIPKAGDGPSAVVFSVPEGARYRAEFQYAYNAVTAAHVTEENLFGVGIYRVRVKFIPDYGYDFDASTSFTVNNLTDSICFGALGDREFTISVTRPVATYTITFVGGEGATGTAPTMEAKKAGTTITLPACTFTREGYTFDGWSDGTSTYAAGAEYTMPAANVTFTAVWTKTPITLPFTDVTDDMWSYGNIVYVYQNGLMNGVSGTLFAPKDVTVRGMIATILYRLEGSPAVTEACPFSEVEPGKYYEKPMTWANKQGIVTGYAGTDKCGAEDPVTREQLATMLYRYAKYKGYDCSAQADLSGFGDYGEIHGWGMEALRWANGKGLIGGLLNQNRIDPNGDATREQLAAILHRFCVNVAK